MIQQQRPAEPLEQTCLSRSSSQSTPLTLIACGVGLRVVVGPMTQSIGIEISATGHSISLLCSE